MLTYMSELNVYCKIRVFTWIVNESQVFLDFDVYFVSIIPPTIAQTVFVNFCAYDVSCLVISVIDLDMP